MNFNVSLINETSLICNINKMDIQKKINSYLEQVIIIFGLITNLICCLVFYLIIRGIKVNTQMFKFFFMKSIFDFLLLFFDIFSGFYNFTNCSIRYSYLIQLYNFYFKHFLEQIFRLISVYFEIFAVIDCYISIKNNRSSLLSIKIFYISSIFNIVFCFLFYIGKAFVYNIVLIEGYNHKYDLKKTDLYYSKFYIVLSFLYAIIGDIFGSIIMNIFNIIIFLEFKKLTIRKKVLTGQANRNLKSQKKKFKMIFISSANFLLLHIPDIIFSIYGKFQNDSSFWPYYYKISTNLLLLSYCTPLFIYIIFNKTFRKYFYRIISFNK